MSNAKEGKAGNIAPALSAAGRAVTATMMAKLAGCGFDGMTPALSGLMALLDANGVRATTLAQRAGITKQAISQLVRELEARGFVEQVPDSTDTRAKIVRLTERGIALHATCSEVKHALQSIAVATLGKARVLQLQQDLVKLTAALEEMRGLDT